MSHRRTAGAQERPVTVLVSLYRILARPGGVEGSRIDGAERDAIEQAQATGGHLLSQPLGLLRVVRPGRPHERLDVAGDRSMLSIRRLGVLAQLGQVAGGARVEDA